MRETCRLGARGGPGEEAWVEKTVWMKRLSGKDLQDNDDNSGRCYWDSAVRAYGGLSGWLRLAPRLPGTLPGLGGAKLGLSTTPLP